jgi:membrane protein implicated in regulation of membrane protease activity
VLTPRRVLGVAGTALLGGALAWAPVAAFTGEMLTVTKAALAGVALLIVMRLLPRRDATPEHRPDPRDEER